MSTSLAALTASQLLKIFNHHAPKPIARFESTASGIKRLSALLAKIEVSADDAIEAVYPANVITKKPTLHRAGLDKSMLRNPAKAGADAAKADDAERDALKASGEPIPAALTGVEAPALVLARDELRAKTAKAAKLAKPVNAAKAGKGDERVGQETGASGKLNAKQRVLLLIARPQGATEAEVCVELGWAQAGATISRAIKMATFTVRKEKDGSKTRYFRGEAR